MTIAKSLKETLRLMEDELVLHDCQAEVERDKVSDIRIMGVHGYMGFRYHNPSGMDADDGTNDIFLNMVDIREVEQFIDKYHKAQKRKADLRNAGFTDTQKMSHRGFLISFGDHSRVCDNRHNMVKNSQVAVCPVCDYSISLYSGLDTVVPLELRGHK